ncbi:MAG: heavy-metal-associated domain-containing protein [Candidatus Korarchaeota archaeon]|nr:heavy-metal-associated domain-containing protein [Candidatus Korarchaeota archaeon]
MIALRVRGSRAISLKISGMHCQNCALTIERELRSLDDVLKANVSFASGKALVIVEPGRLSVDELERAVRRVGYGVEREKVRLRLREAVDPALAARPEGELVRLEG